MKVSVAIPNFNHARFLKARIESVLQQSFQDFDLLILDDASTDDSRQVIAPYVGGRVRFLPSERNSGSTFAQWNRAFAETRGDYIWIAESDDEADPRFLERMVALLDAQPSAGFVFCQATLIDEQGEPFGLALPVQGFHGGKTRYAADFFEQGPIELRNYLRWQMAPVPNASSVLFNRRCVQQAGGADSSYRVGGDFQFYTRLLRLGDVGYVADPLNRYRHHRRTVRSLTARDATDIWERYRIAQDLLPLLDLNPDDLRAVRRKLAHCWIVAAIQNRRTTPLARHRQIWTVARQMDPCLIRHLAWAMGHHLRSSFLRRTTTAAERDAFGA